METCKTSTHADPDLPRINQLLSLLTPLTAETSSGACPRTLAYAAGDGSLRANVSWTFVGNGVYSACQWGMVVLLAKLGSPDLVGDYALGLAIVTPIMFFSHLQLRPIMASDARQEYPLGDYMGFRIISTASALLFIAAMSKLLHYDTSTLWIILLIGCAQAVEALSDVVYARLQYVDRMDLIARSQIVRGPLALLAAWLGLLLTNDFAWSLAGVFVARACVFLFYDIHAEADSLPMRGSCKPRLGWPKQLRPRFVLSQMGRLLLLALPLGVVALLVNLSTNVPRYYIEHSLGRRELGFFSAIALLTSAGNLFVASLGQSAFSRMAVYFAAGRLRDFRILLLRLLGIATAVGLAGILVAHFAGSSVLTFLYNSEYALQNRLLVGLMSVAWLGYLGQCLGQAITAARYFRPQIPLFGLVLLVIATGSYWLVPSFALYGAVLSMLFGTLVQLALCTLVLLFALKRQGRACGTATASSAI
jgi:O-antigen/teichoic acid export membrane protein